MKQRFDAVDLAKFIFAAFVVSIHTYGYTDSLITPNRPIWGELILQLANIAVPFFFISSGFFFFKKYLTFTNDRQRSDYSKRYLARLLSLYLIWLALYMPFIWTKFTADHTTNIIKFGYWLVTGRFPMFIVSWYLAASLVGLPLTIWLIKHLKIKVTLALGILIECSMAIIVLYNFALPTVILGSFENLYIHSFLRGVLYFALGYLCAKMLPEIQKMRLLPFEFMTVGSIILSLAEQAISTRFHFNINPDFHDISFFVPVAAVCLFITCIKSNLSLQHAPALRLGSTFIFMSHVWIMNVINKFEFISITADNANNFVYYAIVFLTALSTFLIINRLKQKAPMLNNLF